MPWGSALIYSTKSRFLSVVEIAFAEPLASLLANQWAEILVDQNATSICYRSAFGWKWRLIFIKLGHISVVPEFLLAVLSENCFWIAASTCHRRCEWLKSWPHRARRWVVLGCWTGRPAGPVFVLVNQCAEILVDDYARKYLFQIKVYCWNYLFQNN